MDRIKALPRGVAHTVLLAICNDPDTLKRAIDITDLLLAPQSPDDEDDDEDDDDAYDAAGVADVAPAPSPSRKRKTPPAAIAAAAGDVFTCLRCEQPFFASRNKHDACKFHDGELEPDLEGGFWDDHELNPDVWGPIDTPENRQAYPQGFYWDCCGKKGDEGPECQVDYHMADYYEAPGAGIKRSRLDGGLSEAPANGGGSAQDDDGDDDSVVEVAAPLVGIVEVAAPLVTIDDDLDEDPPEEDGDFGMEVRNVEAAATVAYSETKVAVAVPGQASPDIDEQGDDDVIPTTQSAVEVDDQNS